MAEGRDSSVLVGRTGQKDRIALEICARASERIEEQSAASLSRQDTAAEMIGYLDRTIEREREP